MRPGPNSSTHVMALWTAEQTVAAWIESELAEYRVNRTGAGYPTTALVAAGSSS